MTHFSKAAKYASLDASKFSGASVAGSTPISLAMAGYHSSQARTPSAGWSFTVTMRPFSCSHAMKPSGSGIRFLSKV